MAQSFKLFAWLGWLRGHEIFSLAISDIQVVAPVDSPRYGLQPYIRFLRLTLSKATKSTQTYHTDVLIAYKTVAGAQPGLWWSCCQFLQEYLQLNTANAFVSKEGTSWTRNYYCHTPIPNAPNPESGWRSNLSSLPRHTKKYIARSVIQSALSLERKQNESHPQTSMNLPHSNCSRNYRAWTLDLPEYQRHAIALQ
eukprot:11650036-Ditylum_brightwellii.AAC.2